MQDLKFDIGGGKAGNKNVKMVSVTQTDQESMPDLTDRLNQNNVWDPDIRLQISSKKWLQRFGLKKNQLDSKQLYPLLGFVRQEEFIKTLQKPIASRYSQKLFPKHFREDGVTFNIVAKRDRLKQTETRLEEAIQMYERRLAWLKSESRRFFGIVQEHSVTIILDVKNMNERPFDQCLCIMERVVREQLVNVARFNLIRCQDEPAYFADQLVPVTKNSVADAVDWLWSLDRLAKQSASNTVEAVIRASRDAAVEAIYLFTENESSSGATQSSREVLREKVRQLRVPFHVVSYGVGGDGSGGRGNNTDEEAVVASTLHYLSSLTELTGGRFHAYSINRVEERFEADPQANTANILAKRRLYGGTPAKIRAREDCVLVFEEIETARKILEDIKQLSQQAENKAAVSAEHERTLSHGAAANQKHERQEEYMSSQEWINKFGIVANKFDFYDVLAGVSFKHCDGVVDILEAPVESLDMDPDLHKGAIVHPKLVNARYCEKFAHILWKDGTLMHVQVTPEVYRLYSQRMRIYLEKVRRRISWLRLGSRELFGTIMEDQIYILIDTSGSMNPSMNFLKEKLYTLIQEQLRHKSRINIVAFNSRIQPWRDRLVEVSEENLKAMWSWINGLLCSGSTNTMSALQYALSDKNTQGIYLLTDGRPDQPEKTVLSQVQLLHRVPVHTISFNCDDRDANHFLRQLARETSGRFHYFSEHSVGGGGDVGGASLEEDDGDGNSKGGVVGAWESEDIRLLRMEYRLGRGNLEKITRLSDECQKLAWKKEVEEKRIEEERKKYRDLLLAGMKSAALSSGGRGDTSSLKKSANLQKLRNRSRSAKSRAAATTPAAATNSSFFHQHQQQQRDEADWMLKETKDLLNEQEERYQTILAYEKNKSEKSASHSSPNATTSTPRRRKHQILTLRDWLNVNGLVPQRLTLLDVLAPTIVKIRPKYVASIDKYVSSKVFDEIFPVAHVSKSKTHYNSVSVCLVNPLAVDLKSYQKHVETFLNKYYKKLIELIEMNLPRETALQLKEKLVGRDRFRLTDSNKNAIRSAFEEIPASNEMSQASSVADLELELILLEIDKAKKYIKQAKELIDINKNSVQLELPTFEIKKVDNPNERDGIDQWKKRDFSESYQSSETASKVKDDGIEAASNQDLNLSLNEQDGELNNKNSETEKNDGQTDGVKTENNQTEIEENEDVSQKSNLSKKSNKSNSSSSSSSSSSSKSQLKPTSKPDEASEKDL